jgi:hypothetical protein
MKSFSLYEYLSSSHRGCYQPDGLSDVQLFAWYFGASCVGFLHQKEALHHKAEHVRTLERELRSLKRSNQLMQEELVALTSPQRLEKEVRRRGLDLVAPKPEDILSLPLPDPRNWRFRLKKAASPDNSGIL